MSVEINKKNMFPFLIYNKEYNYNDLFTIHPIKMKHIVEFQQMQSALTLRKDSIFTEKKFIKMEYLDFIKFAFRNHELGMQYLEDVPFLILYYDFIIGILELTCGEGAVRYDPNNLDIYVNECLITNDIFNDVRRIIIIQNDIDFDIDEFMNIETVKALEKAREFEAKKKKEKSDIEDYIDSLVVGLRVTEEYVSNLTIRKFWRYIKRLNKHDEYQAAHAGEFSGMVTFKEPLTHWMTTLDIEDKYEDLKTNEAELRGKIG